MDIDTLVKQAKSGNKSAFTELIKFYEQDLYKIARARLSCKDDIFDAIQETTVTMYESIKNLSNISSFRSWMIKILINKCNDIYRKSVNSKIASYDIADLDNYTYQTIQFDSKLQFDYLMEKLDYDDRILAVLCYVEGYKPKEIAKLLKMNNNTVRSKLARIRLKLKEILEEG